MTERKNLGFADICPKAYSGCPVPIFVKDYFMRVCSGYFRDCSDTTFVIRERRELLKLENFNLEGDLGEFRLRGELQRI